MNRKKTLNILKIVLIWLAIIFFIESTYYKSVERTKRAERSYVYPDLILSGKHELRKFNVKETTTTSSKASFFLIVGSYSSETTQSTEVRFYFKNYHNEWQLMIKPITSVNIKIDNSVIIPYIKFYWNDNNYHSDIYSIYDECVSRVVIYCKNSDFIPEININNLK